MCTGSQTLDYMNVWDWGEHRIWTFRDREGGRDLELV